MSVASARDDSRGGGVQESLGPGSGAQHRAVRASVQGWLREAFAVAPGPVGQPIKSLTHGRCYRWVFFFKLILKQRQVQTENSEDHKQPHPF